MCTNAGLKMTRAGESGGQTSEFSASIMSSCCIVREYSIRIKISSSATKTWSRRTGLCGGISREGKGNLQRMLQNMAQGDEFEGQTQSYYTWRTKK